MSIIHNALKKAQKIKPYPQPSETPEVEEVRVPEARDLMQEQYEALERQFHQKHFFGDRLFAIRKFVIANTLLLLCCVLLLGAVTIYATWGKGPATSSLVCTGIMYDPSAPIGIINGVIVGIGDEIDGAEIVDINPREVTVDYEGQRLLLPLQR